MNDKLESRLGPRLLGLRVLTVGILIAFSGLGVAWLGAVQAGWAIALCGIITTFVGIAINAFAVFKRVKGDHPMRSE